MNEPERLEMSAALADILISTSRTEACAGDLNGWSECLHAYRKFVISRPESMCPRCRVLYFGAKAKDALLEMRR